MNWDKFDTIKTTARAILLLATALASNSGFAVDKYQYQVLFSPTTDILQAEARGRIMIYDGMKHATVMRAMDEKFDRIENMMFVRTVYEQEDGELAYEEDGCD